MIAPIAELRDFSTMQKRRQDSVAGRSALNGDRESGASESEGQASQVTDPKRNPQAPQPAPPFWRSGPFWTGFIILLAVNWLLMIFFSSGPQRVTVPYTVFLGQVNADNVKTLNARDNALQGEFKQPVSYGSARGTLFQSQRPAFAQDNLEAMLQEHKVPITAEPPGSGQSPLLSILLGFGPTLLLVGAFLYLSRRVASGAGGILGTFGQSRARLYAGGPESRVTFGDVAGIDEAKADLAEVVDFLKEPAKYQRLGATIPRGVLLIGPPGTGKTLLARAVAGKADRPFFSLAASEFVEAIVGVGASRVRDLFSQAKLRAPSIIFIDELDAIGRSRSSAASFGANDEREQTLNQILTEMDGFTPNQEVVVLPASNRAEILDPALLRPGRFDRRVTVAPPDRAGREAILRLHARSVPTSTSPRSAALPLASSARSFATSSTRPRLSPLGRAATRSRRRISPRPSSVPSWAFAGPLSWGRTSAG